MCHQSQLLQNTEQIEQMVENGMPRKIVRTVAYKLRKRADAAAAAAAAAAAQQKQIANNSTIIVDSKDSEVDSVICKKCKNKRRENVCNKCEENIDNFALANQPLQAEKIEKIIEVAALNVAIPNNIPKGCGRAAALANAAARMTGGNKSIQPYTDSLTIVSHLTKVYCQRINQFAMDMQKTKLYLILTRTTQPAHVIAISILAFVLLSIWPNILENQETAPIKSATSKRNGLALVVYLGAFSTHLGAQIWMTFVSGLSLYFSLPRHTFGLCQQILFPKYFALNSVLSICTLILFIKVIAGRWELSSYVQLFALTLCAVIEVAVRLYLAPPLLRLMREKYKFEASAGVGQEIGILEQGDLIKCPHYQRIHKAFRRIHMTVAIGNMAVLICTFLHLNYLASKISVG